MKKYILLLIINFITFQGVAMPHAYPGLLCAIEGIDGAGKTTLIAKLKQKFQDSKLPTIFTKEPGSTQLGKHLRTLLNDRLAPTSTKAEFLLFAADRSQHFDETIIPGLKQGTLIISDRMADSSVAYQGFLKGLDIGIINTINAWCMHNITPDIVIYLRITPDQARERILQNRGGANAFEQEYINHMQTLFDGFETIFQNRPNVITIDALQNENKIAQQVFDILHQKYTEKQHEAA